jgi:Molydopterin dinucleotide binding domain
VKASAYRRTKILDDRGACLAGAVLSDALRPGVVQLATGAWYDPEDPAAPAPFCEHGNPNVLTRDVGTSRLAQGCTGQIALVEIERFAGSLPSIKAFDPPPSRTRGRGMSGEQNPTQARAAPEGREVRRRTVACRVLLEHSFSCALRIALAT